MATILVALQFNGGNAGIIPERTVAIANKLNDYQLGVHCKDKNHDLGFHVLPVGGSYNFKFVVDPFVHNTLYFCFFSWTTGGHYFNIYVQTRDLCSYCYWEIVASGPCLVWKDNRQCYNWNQPTKIA
ncbi:Plant self-incompatibility protein S1 [Sesbania bispinosa]|nr:Plant self-incompatibility protein S1 [Sesbania bispinosa]